jgi:MarR family transcriptional regulator for hemolysin
VTVRRPTAITGNRNILESSIAKVDPQWRLMVQMAWAARKWRILLDQRLREIGQNGARMEALANIAYFPPEATQVQIANRIGIERATVTRMLDSLEADGLVERLADASDRRTKRIRLTEAGANALKDIQEIVVDLRATLLNDISSSALDQTNTFLSEMLINLDKELS